ncbi:MAG: hypothetical protein WA949_04185 [Phormidesmis sp.]
MLIGWLTAVLGINPVWLQNTLLFAIIGLGLSQLLYVIPLSLWLYRQRKFEALKGVAIAAVVTALLCGGCYLYFLSVF